MSTLEIPPAGTKVIVWYAPVTTARGTVVEDQGRYLVLQAYNGKKIRVFKAWITSIEVKP